MGTNIEYESQVELISCKCAKLITDVDIFKNCGLVSLESKIAKMHQSHPHTHYRGLCGVTELLASEIIMQGTFVILFWPPIIRTSFLCLQISHTIRGIAHRFQITL